MLGYVSSDEAGVTDALLARVARHLEAAGWPLAGAIQSNPEGASAGRRHMDLAVLGTGETRRISQDLGEGARGCRLDPDGLESAVGLAEARLSLPPAPRLVIVNKFGKLEIDGRGFRPLIGRALADGIPVLTAASPGNLDGFLAFAEDMADPVPAEIDAVLAWAEATHQEAAAL